MHVLRPPTYLLAHPTSTFHLDFVLMLSSGQNRAGAFCTGDSSHGDDAALRPDTYVIRMDWFSRSAKRKNKTESMAI